MRMAGKFVRLGLAMAMGPALLAGTAIAQSQEAPATPPAATMCGGTMMQGGGPGMMGRGMMMGPGMMGPGMMGPGMMWGYNSPSANLNLSVDDTKAYLERWIAAMGNPRLKPGRVVAKDSDTIMADVVTVDKEALVQRFAVNRHTGCWQQVP